MTSIRDMAKAARDAYRRQDVPSNDGDIDWEAVVTAVLALATPRLTGTVPACSYCGCREDGLSAEGEEMGSSPWALCNHPKCPIDRLGAVPPAQRHDSEQALLNEVNKLPPDSYEIIRRDLAAPPEPREDNVMPIERMAAFDIARTFLNAQYDDPDVTKLEDIIERERERGPMTKPPVAPAPVGWPVDEDWLEAWFRKHYPKIENAREIAHYLDADMARIGALSPGAREG